MWEGLREGSHQLPSCYYKYEKCDISDSWNISHLLERAVEASTIRCQHFCEATSSAVQCKQNVITTTKLTTLLFGNAPTTGCFLVLPIHQTCHECSKSQHLIFYHYCRRSWWCCWSCLLSYIQSTEQTGKWLSVVFLLQLWIKFFVKVTWIGIAPAGCCLVKVHLITFGVNDKLHYFTATAGCIAGHCA